jgi:histidinol phosphatase-like enzyme (inositol monophosphatase family)
VSADLDARLETARRLAREAGRVALERFGDRGLAVDRKGDDSPVTEADRAAERHLREGIAAAFPDDAILGEEYGETPGTSGLRWILDPIDGTKSFIHGVPLFGTLIGIARGDRAVVGVIELPALDERVYARAGGGAFHQRGEADPVPARVSTVDRLDEATYCTASRRGYLKMGVEAVHDRLEGDVRLIRGWCDCYGYFLVATGRAEIAMDPAMGAWDAAALQAVVEEAGGVFTDWEGRPTYDGGNGIATNAALADAVRAAVRESL